MIEGGRKLATLQGSESGRELVSKKWRERGMRYGGIGDLILRFCEL